MTDVLRRLRHTTPRRLAAGLVRRTQARSRVVRDQRRSTRAALPHDATFTRLLDVDAVSWATPDPTQPTVLEMWHANRFELLGSGWVDVSAREPVATPAWEDHVAAHARALLPAGHRPIGWHTDHKSGFTWPADIHHTLTRYGDQPGVDIKVPWELGRAQHLPVLALAAAHDPGRAVQHAAVVRATIADFAANCPPRFGAQWACTMDVGIRIANWLVACDLLAAAGQPAPAAFTRLLGALVEEHARFIGDNLEWYAALRSNHYLANVAGMAAIASYLPPTAQSTAWLQFAAAELVVAVDEQFLPDGANFEGSTSYHRLSAEMVAWAVLLLRRVPQIRQRLQQPVDQRLVPRASRHHHVPVERATEVLDSALDTRLSAMAAFTRMVTAPDGRVSQVGDNDSGRFVALAPVWQPMTAAGARSRYVGLGGDLPDEEAHPMPDHGDHRELLALIAHVTADRLGATPARPGKTVRPVVADAAPAPPDTPEVRWLLTPPPGAALDDGITVEAAPDFGLWVWSGPRLWLAVRCGPVGQAGNGGHAHCDQLGIELWIDGVPWVRDPGTMTYTPFPAVRNAYRSAGAHFVPWHPDGREPNPLDAGLFTLPDTTRAQVLHADRHSFTGVHRGYGAVTIRRVQITGDAVIVSDQVPDVAQGTTHVITAPAQLELPAPVPHSPSYGLQERQR